MAAVTLGSMGFVDGPDVFILRLSSTMDIPKDLAKPIGWTSARMPVTMALTAKIRLTAMNNTRVVFMSGDYVTVVVGAPCRVQVHRVDDDDDDDDDGREMWMNGMLVYRAAQSSIEVPQW